MFERDLARLLVAATFLTGWSAREGLADAWDPGDDDGTGATPITMSETVQEHGPHTTTTQTDVADWFQVSLTAGVLYHFESTGDADMEAFLYSDSAGSNQVAYNDDKIPFTDPSFYIAYSPTASGTYYLKVKQLFNASSTYSLSYYADPPSMDGWDPGDDTGSGATVLAIDEVWRTNGVHVLSSSDPADWFKFTLVAGNTYRFESIGDWDTLAYLYSDESGTTEVASDDQSGAGDNFQIDYKPSVSGDYYLKVAASMPGNYESYTLGYQIIEDQWDPADDTVSGATVLSFASTNHGPHTLSTNDVYDWFQFDLVAGNNYQFTTSVASPAAQDTRGALYSDPSGTNQVAIDDDSGEFDNFMIFYTPSASGTYYLKVEELYGMPAGYWLIYSEENLSGDSDGDGMSDSDEAVAGTNPDDPDSYFAITNWSDGSFIVEWPSFSNRQYQVLWTDNLTNGFAPLGPVLTHPQNSYTDTLHSAEDGGFYKVQVELQ